MKREYMKPAMRVNKLQQKCHILVGSDTANTIYGEELEYIGGDIVPGR
jgi:hypothetical protein